MRCKTCIFDTAQHVGTTAHDNKLLVQQVHNGTKLIVGWDDVARTPNGEYVARVKNRPRARRVTGVRS